MTDENPASVPNEGESSPAPSGNKERSGARPRLRRAGVLSLIITTLLLYIVVVASVSHACGWR
jgi:hypothetical protein